MPTIVDDIKGEMLRRAVNWISVHDAFTPAGIEEASRRFDLSPLEQNFLITLLKSREMKAKQNLRD